MIVISLNMFFEYYRIDKRSIAGMSAEIGI